tara:strand:+ start:1269 stop:1592 length:324 start_codon:yes stop_codon:yes gene_type:complete
MNAKTNKCKKRGKQRSISKSQQLSIETYLKQIIPIYFSNIKDADGLCFNPSLKNSRILIGKNLLTRRRLNVLIEEVTHAFFWDIPEYKVRKFSAQLGRVIYSLFLKK